MRTAAIRLMTAVSVCVRRDERGANLVEYALLIALIVVACLSAVVTFGESVPAGSFTEVSSSI